MADTNNDPHVGGESWVTFYMPPVGMADPVQVNMCVTEIASIKDEKGFKPRQTTCDYDPTDKLTYTRRQQTSSTLSFSFTGYLEDQMTAVQRKALLHSKKIGPVVLGLFTAPDDEGFYLTSATVEIEYKPGATDAQQTFTVSGQSDGKWTFGTTAPA